MGGEAKAKFFALLVHTVNMGINIGDLPASSNIPYASLFDCLTNFALIYVVGVVVTESVICAVYSFEWSKCCLSDTSDDSNTRDNSNNTSDNSSNNGDTSCLCAKFFSSCKCAKRFTSCLCAKNCDVLILGVLILGLVIQASLFTAAATYVNRIEATMDDELYDVVTIFYGMPGRLSITETMNDVQRHLRCCGVDDYVDYFNSTYATLPTYGGRVVPLTCYRIPEEGINAAGHEIDESKIYDTGCLEALIEEYDKYFFKIWNLGITSTLEIADIIRGIVDVGVKHKSKKNKVGDASAARSDQEAHTVQMHQMQEERNKSAGGRPSTSLDEDRRYPLTQDTTMNKKVIPSISTTGQPKQASGKLERQRMFEIFDEDTHLVGRLTF